MGISAGIGVGLVGASAAVYGAHEQANAAKEGIAAQTAAANNQAQVTQNNQGMALTAATPSATMLGQMQTNLDLQNQALQDNKTALARDNSILDSIDPAIKESGTQALALLQGQQASVLGPIQAQQKLQRTALEQSLASSLGPDYAVSSAGRQALSQFDQNAELVTANAQQSSLGQLLGVVQNTASNLNPVNNNATAFNTLGNLNTEGFNMTNQVAQNKISAIYGNQGAQSGAANNQFTAAGNTGVPGAIVGQTVGNLGNTGIAGVASYLTSQNTPSNTGFGSGVSPTISTNSNGGYGIDLSQSNLGSIYGQTPTMGMQAY